MGLWLIPLSFMLVCGVILCGSIAWSGLVRGTVRAAYTAEIEGRVARCVGVLCLALVFAQVAFVFWVIAQFSEGGGDGGFP